MMIPKAWWRRQLRKLERNLRYFSDEHQAFREFIRLTMGDFPTCPWCTSELYVMANRYRLRCRRCKTQISARARTSLRCSQLTYSQMVALLLLRCDGGWGCHAWTSRKLGICDQTWRTKRVRLDQVALRAVHVERLLLELRNKNGSSSGTPESQPMYEP
jgi:hypothetical protein